MHNRRSLYRKCSGCCNRHFSNRYEGWRLGWRSLRFGWNHHLGRWWWWWWRGYHHILNHYGLQGFIEQVKAFARRARN